MAGPASTKDAVAQGHDGASGTIDASNKDAVAGGHDDETVRRLEREMEEMRKFLQTIMTGGLPREACHRKSPQTYKRLLKVVSPQRRPFHKRQMG